MNDRDFVLMVLKEFGATKAKILQQNASSMTSDELISNADFIPDFDPKRQYLNFSAGYICKSPSGNIVKLLQPYDSAIYTQNPENLPAQWGFYWSTDPTKAKLFLKSSTSPYQVDDCCLFNDHIWRSMIPNNVWSPSENASGWKDLGEPVG